MSATLGGLIKDYRLQKNISQLEIAFALGWKEPSRLSRIEQGKVGKPNRDLVEKIIQSLKLNRRERARLLLSGGYLPTDDEVNQIRRETETMLEEWPYPAYLLDFSWRLLAFNKKGEWLYGIKGKSKKYVYEKKPRNLEFLFDPEFPENKYLKGEEKKMWLDVLEEKLIRYKLLHKNRVNEKWYQNFMKTMMKNRLFSEMWQKVQLLSEEIGIINYERKLLINPDNIEGRLDFHILKSPLLQDERFEINYHIPADTKTLRYFS